MTIDHVIREMRATPTVQVHLPADKAEIDAMLRVWRCRLPQSYRTFLTSVGWANLDGTVVYGLGPEATRETAVSEANLRILGKDVLAGLFVISGLESGELACLNVKRIKDGDCPVVGWRLNVPNGIMQEPTPLASTFTEWICSRLRKCRGYVAQPVRQPTHTSALERRPAARSLSQAIAIARRSKFARLGNGVGHTAVTAAEAKLGVVFPAGYRAWLTTVGIGEVNGTTVFGTAERTDPAEDLIVRNLEARVNHVPMLPIHMLAIADDGMGNFFCLDLSHRDDGRCPVVLWDHEHPRLERQRPARVSTSFESWIVKRVRELPDVDVLAP